MFCSAMNNQILTTSVYTSCYPDSKHNPNFLRASFAELGKLITKMVLKEKGGGPCFLGVF